MPGEARYRAGPSYVQSQSGSLQSHRTRPLGRCTRQRRCGRGGGLREGQIHLSRRPAWRHGDRAVCPGGRRGWAAGGWAANVGPPAGGVRLAGPNAEHRADRVRDYQLVRSARTGPAGPATARPGARPRRSGWRLQPRRLGRLVSDSHKWVVHGERLVDNTPHVRISQADVETPGHARFTQYVF